MYKAFIALAATEAARHFKEASALLHEQNNMLCVYGLEYKKSWGYAYRQSRIKLAELKGNIWKAFIPKDVILATERDREVFFDALINPPEPNELLKAVFEEYKKTVISKD